MHTVTSRWPHQGTIKIEWNLGKRCNYDCSYCPASIHESTSPHTDIEILKTAVDKLVTLGKPVRLSFTGGEPCVHPKFAELVKYCKHVGVSWISVTTNGTLPYEFYAALNVDQIVFSIHLEFDWKRVFNTVESVVDLTDKKVIAQIMAHHDHIPAVLQLRSRCLLAHIPNTVRRIRWTQGDHDLFDDMRYNLNDLELLKEMESTVQENVVFYEKDSTMPVFMHANDTCRVGGSLGNIYNGTFIVPDAPVICDRNYCTCAADIPLTKIKG